MESGIDKYIGKKLEGRYEIQQIIGMGGMANVYKAYDAIDQRTVSVKILREEYLGNAEFLRRFKNESKAIALLNHPNIVQVYDVAFTNRMQSIVMEYIDGITLKDYIERQGTLSWKEAIHFTLQILDALDHAHEKGIVHRDIKPHNIMLLQNGMIKVTDFGIARFARSEVKTITDRAIGSVHYISPEQAMGDNTDQKTDIYSVGVLLFEMLTGRVPFEADTAVSVAIKHIQSKAARPTQINPSIPQGLEEITMRAMEKDAAHRYQTTQAMTEDIEKFKHDPSIQFQYKYLGGESEKSERKKYRKAIDKTREEKTLHKQNRKKRVPYLPILAGVTFAFVLATLAFLGLMISLQNPFAQVEEVRVPNLVGLRFDTALSQYAELGVEIIQESVTHNVDFAPGVIFEQNPRAGRTVREGSEIRVMVSEGQQVFQLENFNGQPSHMVRSWLRERGLQYEIFNEHNSTVVVGDIIYTNPSALSEVRSGDIIQLFVSIGQDVQLRSVPDVRGMTLQAARQMLEMHNLRVGEVTYDQSDQPTDTVIAQTPDSGTLHQEGSAINLVVSQGSAMTHVSIRVELPAFDGDVQLQAFADNVLVHDTVLNPSEVGVWQPAFSGTDELVSIQVLINGHLYQDFQLDFSANPPTFQILDTWEVFLP
ncbi:MAG: Stk1 family PASTA domain-containing Ser/Thr kinase [Oscillospiraceae bacterium]|nr:Stk1 family PASTA domain-containing Ser/Thr kinase [Oscillospiraceae bacterium]